MHLDMILTISKQISFVDRINGSLTNFTQVPAKSFCLFYKRMRPNQYRGVVSGIYVFTANIFGLGYDGYGKRFKDNF